MRSAGPYAEGQQTYLDAGWPAVLPLPAREKTPPPTGYTGHRPFQPTDRDHRIWLRAQPDGNLALRAPGSRNGDGIWTGGAIGIDRDFYDKHLKKAGRLVLNDAGQPTITRAAADSITQWLEYAEGLPPLPDTWRSSSRPDLDRPDGLRSGIYWYRLPDGLPHPDAGIPAGLEGCVELIRPFHRYAVAWPSIHPEGSRYEWYEPDGRLAAAGVVPSPQGLPLLPVEWLAAFNRVRRPAAADMPDPAQEEAEAEARAEAAWSDPAEASAFAEFIRDHPDPSDVLDGLTRLPDTPPPWSECWHWDGQSAGPEVKGLARETGGSRYMIFSGSLAAALGLTAHDGPQAPTYDVLDLLCTQVIGPGPPSAGRRTECLRRIGRLPDPEAEEKPRPEAEAPDFTTAAARGGAPDGQADGLVGIYPEPPGTDRSDKLTRSRFFAANYLLLTRPQFTVVDPPGSLTKTEFIWWSEVNGWQMITGAELVAEAGTALQAGGYRGPESGGSREVAFRMQADAIAKGRRVSRSRLDAAPPRTDWLLLTEAGPNPGRTGIHLTGGGLPLGEVPWDQYLTRRLPVDPKVIQEVRSDPEHPALVRWREQITRALPDESVRRRFRVLCGQALVGNPAERVAFLTGPGATGKSKIIEGIEAAFGERNRNGYAVQVDPSEVAPAAANYREARLENLEFMRLLVSSELPKGSHWNMEALKRISGNPSMPVRRLFHTPHTIEVRMLPLFDSNTKPFLGETGEAVERRLEVVPFRVEIPRGQRTSPAVMTARLTSEEGKAATLVWLLAGLAEWQAAGEEPDLPDCPIMEAELGGYVREHNIARQVVEALTEAAPRSRVEVGALLKAAEQAVLPADPSDPDALRGPAFDLPEAWTDPRGLSKFRRALVNDGWKMKEVSRRWYLHDRQMAGSEYAPPVQHQWSEAAE